MLKHYGVKGMKWDKSKLKDDALNALKSDKRKDMKISTITPIGSINYVKNEAVKKAVEANLISPKVGKVMEKIKFNRPVGYLKAFALSSGIQTGKAFVNAYVNTKEKSVDLKAFKKDVVNVLNNPKSNKKKSGRYDA